MAEERTYPTRPFVAVGVVVWRGEEVLLIRRGRPPLLDEWSLPGGAQEAGETIREAAIREVAEETGLAVRPGAVVDVIDLIDRDEACRVRHHYTIVDLVALHETGEARAASDAVALRWQPFARLDDIPLSDDVRRVIRRSASLKATCLY
jgi:ADP-ribose pyrophosphatase YjhB (NUDIX family)